MSGIRRSTRNRAVSGESEYVASDKSMEAPHDEEEQPEPEPVVYATSSRGRKVVKKTYRESASEDDGIPASHLFDDDDIDPPPRRSTRQSYSRSADADDDDEEEVGPRRVTRRSAQVGRSNSFIATDDEDNKINLSNTRYSTRSQTKKPTPPKQAAPAPVKSGPSQRARRFARRNARLASKDEEDVYVAHTSSGASADADGSIDDAPQTSSEPEPDPEPEPGPEEEGDGKPYALRARQRINYAIPPPIEEMRRPPKPNGGGRNGGRTNGHGGGGGVHRPKGRSLGWSATGAELGRWMGMGGDDSDSDHVTRTPRKPYGAAAFGAMGSGMMGGGDLAAVGTPSNFGKISEKASEESRIFLIPLHV